MKPNLRMLAAATALAGLAAAPVAQSHAIWFAQRARQLALIYGIGADDLDSAKRLPLVRSVAGYDAQLKPVPTRLKISGPMVLVDSDNPVKVVTAVMFNGIWTKTPDGEWHKQGKDEVPTALLSEKNWKYTVHIEGPLDVALPAFPDQILEIIPIGPRPVKMGDPLTVRVLFKGQPAAGARVLTDMVNDPDAAPVKTGPDGTVTIKVRNQGLNVVNAVFNSPSDEPTKADRIENEATLSFVLDHLPE